MAAPAPAPGATPTIPAASTRCDPEVVGAGGVHALHEDRLTTSRDNPFATALPFISWDKPAAPALYSAPAYQLHGTFIPLLDFSRFENFFEIVRDRMPGIGSV